MKKQQATGLLLLCALICLAGCYNNTHLRTQRLLEPGEQAVSGSGVLALSGDEPMYLDHLNYTGVAGFRGELSLLTGVSGGERGPYIGLGLADGPALDIIAGYEIKRYTLVNTNLPMKLGVQGELNLTLGDSPSGFAFQFRPSLISASSPNRPFYGGLHGLISTGELDQYADWQEVAGFDEYGDPIYRWYQEDVSYRFSGFGGGITLGWEKFHQTTSVQFQLDASFVQGHFMCMGYTPSPAHHPSAYPDYPFFIATASVGINLFKPRPSQLHFSAPYPASPLRSEEVLQDAASGEPPPRYDPRTGLPLTGRPDTTARLRFDPATGLPLEEEAEAPVPLRFDPETGLLQVETPDTSVIPRFNPETGLPVTVEPGESRPQYDPETGELIVQPPTETEPTDIVRSPTFSETALRNMARNRLDSDYHPGASALVGGTASCSGIGIGSLVGAMLFGFPGFIIGAGAGGVLAMELYVNNTQTVISIPEELESADPDVHDTYRRIYQAELEEKRRQSVLVGTSSCAAVTVGTILLFTTLLLI